MKEAELLAEAIDRCVYETNSNAGHPYRRQMRGIVFTLKHKADIRYKLLSKILTEPELSQTKDKTKTK